MRERQITTILLALTALAYAGCEGGTEAPDASIMLPDTGPARFVGPGTCDGPRVVIGELGTVRLDLDTTDGPMGELDLGTMCGNPEGTPGAPQEVIAYVVPGDGPVGVRFDTGLGDTLTNYDTVIQVRRTCAELPPDGFPPTCFDDISDTDRRSRGSVMAEGGETLYLVIGGFADPLQPEIVDRGPLSVEITATANTPPEIVEGDVRTVAERTEVMVTGRDAEANALGVLVTFLSASGDPLDINGDGVLADQLGMGFDPMPTTAEFTATATTFFIRFGAGGIALSQRLLGLSAASAELVLVDDYFAASAPVTVPIRFLDEVGLGASCGATADVGCTLGLRCVGGACVPTPEMSALCESATALSIETPTTTTTSVSYMGEVAGGFGLIESSCGHSPGQESVLDVTVPPGNFDLIATTATPGTGAATTVLYLRTACPDRLSEPSGGCASNTVVLEDVAEGAYSIFVETAGHPSEVATPFELQVSLRPVLATGADCDPAGDDNRCATGACPSATPVCP